MRRFFVFVLPVGLVCLAFGFGGCGRVASKEDLGTVVFEVPEVPGADAPFAMPELGADDDGTSTPNPGDLPLPTGGGKHVEPSARR